MKITTLLSSLAVLIPFILLTGCTQNNNRSEVPFSEIKVEELEAPVGVHSSLPYLITGGDEHLYLSWVESYDTLSILKYSRLDSTGWSTPETIASGSNWFVNWADYPMIAVDRAGNMIAHYLVKSTAATYSYDVTLRIKPKDSTTWSAPIVPHKDQTPTEHGFVSLLPYHNDTFLLAWLDGRNTGGGHENHAGSMTLRSALINLNGTLSMPTELDPRVCDCCQTTATMTPDGPIVAYRDRSVDEMRDMAYVSFQNNGWTKPALVASDSWKIDGCPVNGPRMGSYEGTTAIAWFSAANNRPVVKVAFKDGESFQTPFVIDDVNPIGRVDLELLDKENALVSWVAAGEDSALMLRRVNKSGNTSKLQKVTSMSPERASGFPQMERQGSVIYFAITEIINDNQVVKIKKIDLTSLF